MTSFISTPIGIPGNSSAQVSWSQEESRLAVLAELQAGSQALTAEFEGGRRDSAAPRWELYSRLQNKIKALVQRGLPSSVQANAHYQVFISSSSSSPIRSPYFLVVHLFLHPTMTHTLLFSRWRSRK